MQAYLRDPSRNSRHQPNLSGQCANGNCKGGSHGGGRRKLILCFDGTGNKFRGDDSDSNILKIFRMLDSNANDQCEIRTPFINRLRDDEANRGYRPLLST